MAKRFIAISVFLLALLTSSASYGQEEEVLGKKRTQWLAILKDHKEAKFRRAAVIALTVIGPRAKGVLDGLFEAVTMDSDPEVRREIALALGQMGTEAKGAALVLGDVLKVDKADVVREAAALSLAGKLNDEAQTQVMALAGALKDSYAGTRAAAAEALKNLGEKAKIALPQLTAVAQDPKADRFPRQYAIQMISKWGDEGTLPVLMGVIEAKETMLAIRQEAIAGIGSMGEKAKLAVPTLARCLQEKNAELRRSAAQALGQVGSDKTKEIWPAVKEAYQDVDNGVRHQVIRLAGKLGKEREAVLLLADAAQKDANLENRLAAIQELGGLEAAAVVALPMLSLLATEDARASVREAAQAAMKKIKGRP